MANIFRISNEFVSTITDSKLRLSSEFDPPLVEQGSIRFSQELDLVILDQAIFKFQSEFSPTYIHRIRIREVTSLGVSDHPNMGD